MHLFTRPIVVQFEVIALSTSPICNLRAANGGRSSASLADKLTVEAKTLANLKIEKAAVEGERQKVEADLGPVKYLAKYLQRLPRARPAQGPAMPAGTCPCRTRRGPTAGRAAA